MLVLCAYSCWGVWVSWSSLKLIHHSSRTQKLKAAPGDHTILAFDRRLVTFPPERRLRKLLGRGSELAEIKPYELADSWTLCIWRIFLILATNYETSMVIASPFQANNMALRTAFVECHCLGYASKSVNNFLFCESSGCCSSERCSLFRAE